MLKSVRLLTRKYTDIVNVNDYEDMTALEYAICGNFHIDVVKSLQRASERYFRAEKKKQMAREQSQSDLQNENKLLDLKSQQTSVQLSGRRQVTSKESEETSVLDTTNNIDECEKISEQNLPETKNEENNSLTKATTVTLSPVNANYRDDLDKRNVERDS